MAPGRGGRHACISLYDEPVARDVLREHVAVDELQQIARAACLDAGARSGASGRENDVRIIRRQVYVAPLGLPDLPSRNRWKRKIGRRDHVRSLES